ncbi:MAG: hypothetical protein V5A61_03435 [Haloarculaceae archaeon]
MLPTRGSGRAGRRTTADREERGRPALVVFGLGSYLVPTGPSRGVESAGERAGPDGP